MTYLYESIGQQQAQPTPLAAPNPNERAPWLRGIARVFDASNVIPSLRHTQNTSAPASSVPGWFAADPYLGRAAVRPPTGIPTLDAQTTAYDRFQLYNAGANHAFPYAFLWGLGAGVLSAVLYDRYAR